VTVTVTAVMAVALTITFALTLTMAIVTIVTVKLEDLNPMRGGKLIASIGEPAICCRFVYVFFFSFSILLS
jgi:hypothetical protein